MKNNYFFKLRKARIEDIDNLCKVEMSSGYHKKKFNFRQIIEKLFREKAEIFCVELKRNLIGYVVLTKKGEISFLVVSKKFQGKGIGSLLLKKAIVLARRKKLKKIFLDVRKDNFIALKLYFKFGFFVKKEYKKKINGKEIEKLRLENIF